MSKYRILIIRADGEPVFLYPGGKGERDLVQSILDKVAAKGVGFSRTTDHVLKAVEDSIHEVILELKSEIVPTQ